MKRSDGERVRLEHSIARLRAVIVGLETGMKLGGPLGTEVAQTVMQTAAEIGMQIAKHDAYAQAERDLEPPVCETCKDTHRMQLGEMGEVPCTRCPSPCEKCRQRLGAYCRSTPCSCECHRSKR